MSSAAAPLPASRPPAAGVGARRWLMLALGTAAQVAAFAFVYGVPFLVPELRATQGLGLARAGLLVAAPAAGERPAEARSGCGSGAGPAAAAPCLGADDPPPLLGPPPPT